MIVLKMECQKLCPDKTTVYISGPELQAAWKLKETMQLNSLSWAVRLLVRAGIKVLDDSSPQEVESALVEESK